jgi:hypothetical protein
MTTRWIFASERRNARRVALASALAPLLLCFPTGCAMQQKQVSQDLDRPGRIDCRTADGDLRVLQSEKAHVGQRLVEGATAIYPADAVMGILAETEGTKLQVATGDYNDKIDARMAEIKSKCGI